MSHGEAQWFRARLLGNYRALGIERGREWGQRIGGYAALLTVLGVAGLFISGSSPLWWLLGCPSVLTLGAVAAGVVYFIVQSAFQAGGALAGGFADMFLRRWLHQRLLQQLCPLAEAGDVDAVAILAEYVGVERTPRLTAIARESLRRLHHRRAIHQVCQVWLNALRNNTVGVRQALEPLILEQRWVASQPLELRLYTALLNEAYHAIDLNRPDAVPILIQISYLDEPLLAPRAYALLEQLHAPAAIDALCEAFLTNDDPLARALILKHSYLPADATRQALTLFLTEQFERYEAMDPDHQLLSAAYFAAAPALQQRLLEQARRAGRIELMRQIVRGDARKRARDLTDREWSIALELLTRQQRWDDMWRLALQAPPRWAHQILLRLTTLLWNGNTLSPEERALWQELRALLPRLTPPAQLPLTHEPFEPWRTLEMPGEAQTRAIDISHDGNYLIVGRTKRVEIYELHSGRCLRALKLPHPLRALAANPMHPLAAIATTHANLYFYTLPDLQLRQHERPQGARDLRFHSRGHRLLCCRWELVLDVWESAGAWRRISTIRPRAVQDYAFDAEQHLLIATGSGVSVWRIRDAMYQRSLVRADGAQAVAFTTPLASAPRLAVGFRSGVVRVCELLPDNTRSRDFLPLAPAEGAIMRLHWAAADEQLLGVGANQLTRWRLHHPEPIQRIAVDALIVQGACITPQADALAVATPQRVELWATPLRRLMETPTGQLTSKDMEWLEDPAWQRNADSRGAWVEFIRLLARHQMRYDIALELDAPMTEVGEYDIDIEAP